MEKFLSFFAISLFLIAIFLAIHILHFRIFKPEFVLKASIIDALLTVLTFCAILILFTKQDKFVIFSSGICTLLFLAIYSILIPTMVDRSISVYLLIYLNDAKNNELEVEELKKRLRNPQIIEKRLTEHQRSGAIEIKNNKIKITKKGKILANIFLYDEKILKLKKNY